MSHVSTSETQLHLPNLNGTQIDTEILLLVPAQTALLQTAKKDTEILRHIKSKNYIKFNFIAPQMPTYIPISPCST